MTANKPIRASTPRQRWLELDGLAQQYLALPAGDSLAREQLRQRILRLLAAGWVKFTSDGEAQRDEDVLSRTFREQARVLARTYSSNSLAQAYGGLNNLGDEAKAEFLARRASRAGRQQQTLLTGLLSGWDPGKGKSLKGFMQEAVRWFLRDLHRASYGRQDELNSAPGATPRGFMTEDGAAAGDEGPEDYLGASALGSVIANTPDADAMAQTEELFACLKDAREALPAAQRAVYDSEIRRHSDQGFTDAQQAASLGLGSRNTLYKQRLELNAALRKLLAAAGHGDGPA